MFFFPDEAMSPDIQWFKDVVRTRDILLYQRVTFFPGEAMSPDMQCFKDVVSTVPRPSLQYTRSPSSDSNPGPFLLHHYFSA